MTTAHLTVECPSCCAGPGHQCVDLGFGAVALKDGVHPDRLTLFEALAKNPALWDPAFIIDCPTCLRLKGHSCITLHSGDTDGERVHPERARAYVEVTNRLLQLRAVDHPPHYNSHPSGVECIDIIEHMTFNVGSSMKYLWRHGLKPSASSIEDLKKAAWYANREIERLSKR